MAVNGGKKPKLCTSVKIFCWDFGIIRGHRCTKVVLVSKYQGVAAA